MPVISKCIECHRLFCAYSKNKNPHNPKYKITTQITQFYICDKCLKSLNKPPGCSNCPPKI